MIDGGSLKIYASMMKSMDAGIGRVLEALERAQARARHARDLHERQRRRALFVQLAVLVPEDVPARGRHARAGDRPLARRDSRGPRHRSGGDHDGLDRDDPRGHRKRRRTRPIRSTARACCPCARASAPRTIARCSGAPSNARPRASATGSTSRTRTASTCSTCRSIRAKKTTARGKRPDDVRGDQAAIRRLERADAAAAADLATHSSGLRVAGSAAPARRSPADRESVRSFGFNRSAPWIVSPTAGRIAPRRRRPFSARRSSTPT